MVTFLRRLTGVELSGECELCRTDWAERYEGEDGFVRDRDGNVDCDSDGNGNGDDCLVVCTVRVPARAREGAETGTVRASDRIDSVNEDGTLAVQAMTGMFQDVCKGPPRRMASSRQRGRGQSTMCV